ncbi:hypothetical protein C8J57DRAFT_1546245 [Mycena rebaudengoi]|nr:hypothetical protein C8J57DRAFT_1546245 [Mycena rebaudengoi]
MLGSPLITCLFPPETMTKRPGLPSSSSGLIDTDCAQGFDTQHGVRVPPSICHPLWRTELHTVLPLVVRVGAASHRLPSFCLPFPLVPSPSPSSWAHIRPTTHPMSYPAPSSSFPRFSYTPAFFCIHPVSHLSYIPSPSPPLLISSLHAFPPTPPYTPLSPFSIMSRFPHQR